MSNVIAFPTMGDVETSPSTFDRACYRAHIEAAARFCLDLGHSFVDLLDRIDGDPDFEPDADLEDGGDREPSAAALVGAIAQIRWAGFDTLVSGEPA